MQLTFTKVLSWKGTFKCEFYTFILFNRTDYKPNMDQAIIWTKDDLIFLHVYAPLCFIELI